MQLKAKINHIAKEKSIPAQLILQIYMIERFLERVSVSPYKNNFILKGGLLIGSILGFEERTTMDMDASIKNASISEKSLREMFIQIINMPVDDDINFEFNEIRAIHLESEYGGYRISFFANYEKMSVPLKLDITTGDIITPKEITYMYRLMLEDRKIPILAYNLPTILAEKLHSIISRGNQNTRLKDFYDVFILTKLQSKNIDLNTLGTAINQTFKQRNSLETLAHYEEIINVIKNDERMTKLWNDYCRRYPFAHGISFEQTCNAITNIMSQINKTKYIIHK